MSVSESLARLVASARPEQPAAASGVGADLREIFASGGKSLSSATIGSVVGSNGSGTMNRRRMDEDESALLANLAAAVLCPACEREMTSAASGFGVSARRAAAETVAAVAATIADMARRHKLLQTAAQQSVVVVASAAALSSSSSSGGSSVSASSQHGQMHATLEGELQLSSELKDVLLERSAAAVVQKADLIRAVASAGWSAGEEHDGRYLADLSRRVRWGEERKRNVCFLIEIERVFASHLKKEGLSGATALSLWSYLVAVRAGRRICWLFLVDL